MGVLPKAYQVPSIQALRQNRFAEGKVSFVGFEFLGEVRSFFTLLLRSDAFFKIEIWFLHGELLASFYLYLIFYLIRFFVFCTFVSSSFQVKDSNNA